nr:hypothetical protein [Tanacetum cinerariifolium]
MGDEHLNTISATESDEFIKSYVENLVPNPSEPEGVNGCDVPPCFTTFSNILFDADYEFDSSDDQSLYDEDVPEKIFSNPLFEEEIIPIKIDQHHDNAESDLVESLRIHDSSLFISSKIDSLLDEFAGVLTLLKSIPLGINEADCDPKEDIRLIERLLYDNSSPLPPEEFVSKNSNANIEFFSPSPIPNKDSDSPMEEIDLSFTPDYPMLPGIDEDDYDSERDILILEELLDNYSLSLPENESFHFDIPSSLVRLQNHQMGLDIFQPSAECPMMICGKNTPNLDVPLFHFTPLTSSSMGELGQSKRLKQALRGRQPMLIISKMYITPCFVNGLEAYDGEINLEQNKNLISNEFASNLCLEHEVKNEDKVVKKELIVALKGEIYFVKFIINPEEDDIEPGMILESSFMRLTKGITNFRNGFITIYPELDPFLDNSEETKKSDDDWELILDGIHFGDILDIERIELPTFVCKMGKSARNRRRLFENHRINYFDKGPSLNNGKPLTQEEASRKAISIDIYKKRGSQTDEPWNNYAKSLKGKTYGTLEIHVLSLIGRGFLATAQTSINTKESESDEEEEYIIKRNSFIAPIYGPNSSRYLNCKDPIDRALAFYEILNPYRKICVWKKVVGFLRSLPVPLHHLD